MSRIRSLVGTVVTRKQGEKANTKPVSSEVKVSS